MRILRLYGAVMACSLFMISCDTNAGETESEKATTKSVLEDGTFCFRTEITYQNNPGKADVLELTVIKDGEKARGSFNFLPAEKDKRMGDFVGLAKENTIDADYTFMQEGVEQTVKVTITLSDEEASIKSSDRAFGMDSNLKRATCK